MPRRSARTPAAAEGDGPPDWSPVPERPATRGEDGCGIVLRAAAAPLRSRRCSGRAAPRARRGRAGHRAPPRPRRLSLLPGGRAPRARIERAIQHVAGRVLALVLLGGVQLLVFTPLSLLLRLLRHNPLALGASPDDPTFWRPARSAPRRPLYRRPFAYERLPPGERGGDQPAAAAPARGARPGRAARRCSTSASAPRSTRSRRPRRRRAATAAAGSRGQTSRRAAGESPGACRWAPRSTEAWDSKRYDPYLGWTDARLHGPLRERRATACAAPTSRAGGDRPAAVRSTSSAARRCSASSSATSTRSRPSSRASPRRDGIPVRVVNYGQLAYVNWQETLLLEQLVTRGQRRPTWPSSTTASTSSSASSASAPTASRRTLDAQRDRRSGSGSASAARRRAAAVVAAPRTDAWADVSARPPARARAGPRVGGARGRRRRLRSTWAGRPDRPTRSSAARCAASIYGRGVDVARRLAGSYGFETAFFWQPSVYSKRVVAGRGGAARLARHRRRARGARPTRAARARLGPAVDRPQRRPRRRAQAGDVRLRPHQRAGRARWSPAPSTSACGRSCCELPASSGRERPRDQRLLPRLRGRAGARRASWWRPPRRSASRASSTTSASRQRDPLLPAGRRGRARTASTRSSTTTSRSPPSCACCAPTCASGPAGFGSFHAGDAAVAAQEALDPVPDRARPARPRLPDARPTSTSPSTTRATPPAPSSRRRSSRPRCSPSTAWASGPRAASASARATASRSSSQLFFPNSLGLLYSAFTYYCGFRVNSGEYKLMGLAPYGEPRYADAHPRRADRPARGRLVPHEHALLRLPRRR